MRTQGQALVDPWQAGHHYAVGDLVLYDGVTYRCRQDHTALQNWTPSATGALWEEWYPAGVPGSAPTPGTLSSPPSLEEVLVENDCLGAPESCCPAGSLSRKLTEGADTLQILTPGECVVAAAGNDTVFVQSSGPSALHLGLGDDTAMDGPGDDLILGGPGRDTINAYGGTNLMFGGPGDDTILAANGANTVVPGPGRDTVALGTGNDTLYILDLCEVTGGESLNGGSGHDKLVSPVGLAELQALGVSVAGFEEVVIQKNSCLSECVAKPDCHGKGVCAEGEVTGQVTCACEPGFEPPSCTLAMQARAPRELPEPPREIGCYRGTREGWERVSCTPQDKLEVPIPYVDFNIHSRTAAEGGPTQQIPYQFAQVETVLSRFGGVQDTTFGANSLSVQLNTGSFASPVSALGAVVQFVVQKSASFGNAICIWQINKSIACGTGPVGSPCTNEAGYAHDCVGGTSFSDFGVAARTELQQFDYGLVGGAAYNDAAGNPVIGMVAQISWYDPSEDPDGLFALVVPDNVGLHAGWVDASGTMLGLGEQSEAQFTDSAVLTRLLAGSCANAHGPDPEVPWPRACSTQEPLLPNTLLTTVEVTAETTNLLPVGSPTTLASFTNDAVFTQYLSTNSGSCTSGGDVAFVRDSAHDVGVVPSNAGGDPFWESPDIFVVPQGQPVSVDGIAAEAVMSPGQDYDIYVRVHNDYGCETITGARALVRLSNPAALSSDWSDVTGGQYVGGVNVPPGGQALIGPIPWTAPANGPSDGHKCLLAAIETDSNPAPTNTFDAPGSAQVAQRNVQISECNYPLVNSTGVAGLLALQLTAEGADVSLASASHVGVTLSDPGGAWYGVWSQGAGADYAVAHNDGLTTVRLGKQLVVLPSVAMASGQSSNVQGAFVLQQGHPSVKVSLGATLLGVGGLKVLQNGASCVAAGAPVIR